MKFAADTSFIIGLFVDEPRSAPAKNIYKSFKDNKESIFIPAQTIIEVIYVLEKFYKLCREEVSEYIHSILGTTIFKVEKHEVFYRVLDEYIKRTSINLGDLLIAEECKSREISTIITFDKHFLKLGLKILSTVS